VWARNLSGYDPETAALPLSTHTKWKRTIEIINFVLKGIMEKVREEDP